jgi:hypothetical protein
MTQKVDEPILLSHPQPLSTGETPKQFKENHKKIYFTMRILK